MIERISHKELEMLDAIFLSIVARYQEEFLRNDFYTDKEKEGYKPFLMASEDLMDEAKKVCTRNMERIIKKINERQH